ncbi:MAG: dTDP-4-dehydrorhamnose reductase [Methanomassiliicoccales archaeon]
MRVAVVGASGLLGQYLAREAHDRGHEVLGTYNRTRPDLPFRVEQMDITDWEEVKRVLEDFSPDFLLHPAAMTGVDECERYPDAAWKVNVEGTMNTVQACLGLECPVLYVSTDYVFNGLKESPYKEGDFPDPLSIYARTKLEGERATLDASRDNMVARVSVVFGWNRVTGRGNFVTWVIDSLRKGKELSLFRDQRVSPTYAPFAAGHTLDLALSERSALSLFQEESRGIYHLSGRECIDRYELGLMIADVFELDRSLISEGTLEEMDLTAPRPGYSCLDVGKVEAELDIELPSLREALEHMREVE